jgi:hypothetical protein
MQNERNIMKLSVEKAVMLRALSSIILTGTIPCDGKVKPKMSQSADVWLMSRQDHVIIRA